MPFGTDGKNRKRMTLADVGIDPPRDRFAPRSGASPKFVLIVLLLLVVLTAILIAFASLPKYRTPPTPPSPATQHRAGREGGP